MDSRLRLSPLSMRFLMLNWRDPRNPKSGGAERVTMGYWAELARRGHEAWWFAQAFAGCKSEEEINGVRIVRQGGNFDSRIKARRWYRRQAPFDLVVDQFHGIPWMAPWWCRTRCVAYLHEVLGPIWDCFYPWPWNVLGRIQEPYSHRLYRRVPFWTGCESTRQLLQSRGIPRVKVISYGVETAVIEALEPKRLAPPLRLTMVSRFAPNKRLDHGIRVLRLLRDQAVDAHLTLMGTGDEERKLRQLARDLGLETSCTFTGFVDEAEKLEILRASHLILHASLREGWGLNIVEANAMGTPAIVYPVPGLVDSTRHLETGIIAGGETPAAMVAAIQDLLWQPALYEKLRQGARDHARSMHWRHVLPPACDWLESMATAPGPDGIPQ